MRETNLNDSPARLTPYELVFRATPDFEERIFPEILEEAGKHGVDPLRRDRFSFLSRAGDAIRDVIPEDAPPEAFEQYRALLFHAFNFWAFGRRLYALEPAVARYLVEGAPSLEGWELTSPYPSVYVQLPPQLFWGSISPDSTPEPVDGFFATIAEADDPLGPPFQSWEVLVVLGIRRERAGFSIMPFDTEVGPGIAATWAEAPGRESAADFANVLPGGEISGLYSILTTAEVLKLLARALWFVDSNPEGVTLETAPDRAAMAGEDAPPLPRIPYFRVAFAAHSPDTSGEEA